MMILPIIAVALLYFSGQSTVVYWVEFAAIWVFGAYWIIKSIGIRNSSFDETAIENVYKSRLLVKDNSVDL